MSWGRCTTCDRELTTVLAQDGTRLPRRHRATGKFGPMCPGSYLPARMPTEAELNRKFGYEHMVQMQELEAEVRAANPGMNEGLVYLEACKLHPVRFPRGPSLRERQAMNPIPVRPAPPRFTQEELAYLAGKLAMVNDPTGQSILDKLAKMLEHA